MCEMRSYVESSNWVKNARFFLGMLPLQEIDGAYPWQILVPLRSWVLLHSSVPWQTWGLVKMNEANMQER